MTFGVLALLVAAGLVGPVLSSIHRAMPPAVVGEIAAGLVIGTSGFKWISPTGATLQTLSDIGFAMLMFIVGTHLPVRNPALRPALARGFAVAATVIVLAVGVGFLLAPHVGLGRPMVLAVLLSTSSAAVALPLLQALTVEHGWLLVVTAWVAIADVATVLAVPLVMSTGALGRVAIGGVVVIVGAVVVYLLTRVLIDGRAVRRIRESSRVQGWAVDLRISILVLFVLAWVATRFGTSILVAGFAVGAAVAALGEPRRVAQQLIGLGEGFFVPIFFVTLGARLDLAALWRQPRLLVLAAAVLAATVIVHVVAASLWRLPLSAAFVSSAQLGVPSAIVSIGLQSGRLTPAQGAAIMAAVLGSLGVSAIGSAMAGRVEPVVAHA